MVAPEIKNGLLDTFILNIPAYVENYRTAWHYTHPANDSSRFSGYVRIAKIEC